MTDRANETPTGWFNAWGPCEDPYKPWATDYVGLDAIAQIAAERGTPDSVDTCSQCCNLDVVQWILYFRYGEESVSIGGLRYADVRALLEPGAQGYMEDIIGEQP